MHLGSPPPPPRFENEMAIRQSVEADIGGLKKVIDDTNMGRMNIESEIEAVKEELMYLKKNHENVSKTFSENKLFLFSSKLSLEKWKDPEIDTV